MGGLSARSSLISSTTPVQHGSRSHAARQGGNGVPYAPEDGSSPSAATLAPVRLVAGASPTRTMTRFDPALGYPAQLVQSVRTTGSYPATSRFESGAAHHDMRDSCSSERTSSTTRIRRVRSSRPAPSE